MYIWTVAFDMVPELVKEGDEWLEKVGMASWIKQPFVKGVTVTKNAFTSFPRRTMFIEVTSLDELQKYMSSPTRIKGRPEFERLVRNEVNTLNEVMCRSKKP